jgi:hypothetical protein
MFVDCKPSCSRQAKFVTIDELLQTERRALRLGKLRAGGLSDVL